MRYLVYWPEEEHEDRPFGKTEWWIMKFCGWFGVHPVRLTGEYTIADAVVDDRFDGCSWVFLDPHADQYLSRTTTPREHVVFAVGHDEHGFYGYDPGPVVKLPSMHPDGVDEEYHSAIAATLLLCRLYL